MMLCALLMVFAVASAGMTMSWFTDEAVAADAVFTAGTVELEAGGAFVTGESIYNWNPGDCTKVEYDLCNNGTKAIAVRVKFEKEWLFVDTDAPDLGVWPSEAALLYNCSDCPSDSCLVGWSAPMNPPFLDGWEYDDGYYYYLDEITSGQCLQSGAIDFCVYFNHLVGNEYQGKTFKLKATFEAVQSSNFAPFYEWETNKLGVPTNCTPW
jgi:hypothetical protein